MLKPGWIGGPANWTHLAGGWNSLPSQGWKTQRNLLGKSWLHFWFQRLEPGFPGPRYTAPPASKCLTQNVFLPDELSYKDVQQQPFLLTMAYAQGLQYWVERFNPPEDPDFCPLARSVLELRERVKEHIIFTKQDIIQGLGRINLGATSQWPQPTPTGLGRVDPPLSPHVTISEGTYTTVPLTRLQVDDWPVGQNASFMEVTTQTASPTMSRVEVTRPITPPDNTEEENWYVLVMTALIRQLNLETTGVVLWETVTASPRRSAFQNPHMVAVLSGPARRVISDQGAIVKELERTDAEWGPLVMN